MNILKRIVIAGLVMLPFVVEAAYQNDSIDIEKNFDSLIMSWHAKPAASDEFINELNIDSASLTVDHPDSFYISRLERIPSVIPLMYNDIIKKCIGVYTIRKRDKLSEILGLKEYYFPIIEEILDQYNIPLEFKYLAVIESALNPRAVSHCGATGIWQFMYGTGRLYKLSVNSYVDDRRDLFQATHAAARFLRDLYKIYGDWGLVIAAYNCGPGNVNKAIRRSGGKRDYWGIYHYLPRETRSYYPLYVAATYAMNYYKDHNIVPQVVNPLPISDTVMVSYNLHLQQVADVLGVSIEKLRDINPQFRRDVIPGRYATYPLRIPAQYADKYFDLKDSIFNYKRDEFFKGEFKVVLPSNSRGTSFANAVPKNSVKVYHTIKSSETLSQIADKYKVSVSDIRYWNNMSGSSIVEGKKLIVYTVKSSSSTSKSTASKSIELESSKLTGDFISYKVKNGDNLWQIAKNYSVTGDDLLKWNNIADARLIKPGQTIKIKKVN